MDRVLCVTLCIVAMVVAVCVTAYCGNATAEFLTEEPTTAPVVVETEPTYVEETTVATEPPYTAEELEHLAVAIYQEAGGDACSDETRLMVGSVVMNRVEDSRFPDTLHGVLTQKSQYGLLHWTGVVWPERASNPGEAHAVERAYDLGGKGHYSQQDRMYFLDGKAPTVPRCRTETKFNVYLGGESYKKTCPVEIERLQTLPDNYTKVDGVSKTARFEAIGNGWTVDVIAHIFKGLKQEVTTS